MIIMRRAIILLFMLVAFLLASAFSLSGQEAPCDQCRDVHITSGILSANDVEREEGYFAIGQGVMLMVKQDSPPHLHLKQLTTHKIELIVRILP